MLGQNSSHMYIMAHSYPQLYYCLQGITSLPLDRVILDKMLKSPVLSIPAGHAAEMAQIYVDDTSMINVVLDKVNKIIKTLEAVNYDHLTDAQRSRISEFAKEVDLIDEDVRTKVYQEMSFLHFTLNEKLEIQKANNVMFTQVFEEYMDAYLAHVGKTLGVELKWTDGKQIILWEEIRAWTANYPDIDFSAVYDLEQDTEDKQSDLQKFAQAIVLAETLIQVSNQGEEAKGLFESSTAKKAVKACLNYPNQPPACVMEEKLPHSLYEKMKAYYDETVSLIEEVASFPNKNDEISEDMQASFAKSIKASKPVATLVMPEEMDDAA